MGRGRKHTALKENSSQACILEGDTPTLFHLRSIGKIDAGLSRPSQIHLQARIYGLSRQTDAIEGLISSRDFCAFPISFTDQSRLENMILIAYFQGRTQLFGRRI